MRTVSETAMLEYIKETPVALSSILEIRTDLVEEIVDAMISQEINDIVITGSGTSYHGGYAAKSFIEKITGINTEAFYPIPFVDTKKVLSNRTLVIGISQGGESMSTVKGLNHASNHGCLTASITADDDGNRVSQAAGINIPLSCGSEYAGPKTKGYQATMLILMLIGVEYARKTNKISDVESDSIIKRIKTTVDNQSNVIEGSIEWYNRNKEELKRSNRIIIVGYGNNYANVLEGRLKIQEAVRYGVEGYELEEFMHGIYHSIDEKVFMFHLLPNSEYKERGENLSGFLKDWTPFHYLIGNVDEKDRNLSSKFIDDEDFSVFEYILPLQIIAFHLSKDLGINPNIPKIKGFHYLMGSK